MRTINKIGLRYILILGATLTMATPLQADDAAEIQAKFEAATAALEENRLNTARQLLNALLADNPTLHRARLELARAYYLSADYDQAELEAQRVLDDPETPPSVRATVLAFQAQIREDRRRFADRHQWLPSIYLGVAYDSNLNFGPARDVIDIGGLPFAVAPNSQENEDWAGVIDAGLTHIYNPGVRFEAGEQTGFFIWESQLNGYYRGYFDEDDFNLGVATLRTGPTWFVPSRWRANIGLQGDQVWLGDGRLAFYTSLNPNVTWQLSPSTDFSLEGIVAYRDYSRSVDSGRDGWYQWGGAKLSRYFNNRRFGLQGGAGYFNFDADDNRFSFKGPDLFVGVVADTWTGGSVFARAGYRNYDFKGIEPGFNVSRDDDEYRLSAGFRHDFQGGLLRNWSLLGDYTFTDNESDKTPIYTYDRNFLNLGLSRAF